MNLQQYAMECQNASEDFNCAIRSAAEQFRQRVNNARVELMGDDVDMAMPAMPEPSRPDKY